MDGAAEGDAGSALATAGGPDGAAAAPVGIAEGDAGSALATADGKAAVPALAVGLYADATGVGAVVGVEEAEAVAAAQRPRPASTATEGPRTVRDRRRDRLIIRVLSFWGTGAVRPGSRALNAWRRAAGGGGAV